jgi:TolA-binding protein
MVSSVFAQECEYDKALKAYMKNDFRSAVTCLIKYVNEKPDPDAYYLLGYASYKLKRHDEAMKYFREAYLIDPDSSPELFAKKLKLIGGRHD